jgi:hypothetical protein
MNFPSIKELKPASGIELISVKLVASICRVEE